MENEKALRGNYQGNRILPPSRTFRTLKRVATLLAWFEVPAFAGTTGFPRNWNAFALRFKVH